MYDKLEELEVLSLRFKGVSDLLGMLYDCVVAGANNYDNGLWLLNDIAFNYSKRLKNVKDKLWDEFKKSKEVGDRNEY